jgi:hypothetical protein
MLSSVAVILYGSSCSNRSERGQRRVVEAATREFNKSGQRSRDYVVTVRTNLEGPSWLVFFDARHNYPYGTSFAYSVASTGNVSAVVDRDITENKAMELARAELLLRRCSPAFCDDQSVYDNLPGKWHVLLSSRGPPHLLYSVVVDKRTGSASLQPVER